MRSVTADVVLTLGEQHAGVITHAEVVPAGLDPSLPSREVNAGRWQRLLPGLYLATSEPATQRQRLHAAALHAGPRGVISGRAGCELRDVRGLPTTPGLVTVLVPHVVRRSSTKFVKVVRMRAMPKAQVLQREGHVDLRVALLDQCVVDAVREEEDLGEARVVAVAAMRDKAVNWAEVVALSRRQGPGGNHLRRAVQDVTDGVRSPAEGDLHDVLARAARRGQLPPYLLNPDVYVDGVLIGSPDVWFVGYGLGDELDSREWHGSQDALDATLQRHEHFRRAGLLLSHITPTRFRAGPADHVAALRDLVAERKALTTPEPTGLVVLGRGPLLPARTPWPQVDPSRPR
jgi:hypothetical protein